MKNRFNKMKKSQGKPGQNPPENGQNLLSRIAQMSAKSMIQATLAFVITIGTIVGINRFVANESAEEITDIEVEEINDSDTIYKITPPVESLDVDFEKYSIDPEKSHDIVTSTGSVIHIPKEAFVDSNGILITSELQVEYREFHTVFDVYRSGIPMQYDSGAQSFTFETAGMFELHVYDANQVEPAFAKELSVDMVTHDSADRYNNYYFDEGRGQWEYMSRSTTTNPPQLTVAKREDDRAPIERVNPITPPKTEIPKLPVKPAFHSLLSDKYTIDVDFSREEFPELESEVVFQIDESNTDFTPAYFKVDWDSVKLMRSEKTEYYTVYAEKNKESVQIEVFPVISTELRNKLQARYDSAKTVYDSYMAQLQQSTAPYKVAIQEVEILTQMLKPSRQFRTMSVSRPGIYNCDHPIYSARYFNTSINASFSYGSEAVSASRAYVVDMDKVALFSAANSNNIQYDPKKKLLLWIWTMDGLFGVCSPEEFQMIDGSEHKFEVTLYKPEDGMNVLEQFLYPDVEI